MHASRLLILVPLFAAAAANAVLAQDTAKARVPAQMRPLAPGVLRQAPTPAPGAPTIASLKPVGVRTVGGDAVTIVGTNFVAGTTVTVGGQGVGVTIVSPTQLRIGIPAGPAGAKDVVVATSGGSATCAACLTFDPDLGPGEWIDTMMERGSEGPLGVWREERLQKGTATTVLMEAHCPISWVPIGAGIENSAQTPFYMAMSYPLDNKWRIQMERRMVPPVGGQLLFPPAPYTFWMTVTCINPDAFNRVMRPPSD